MTKKQIEQRLEEIKDCFTAIKKEMLCMMDDYRMLSNEIDNIDNRLKKMEGDDLK